MPVTKRKTTGAHFTPPDLARLVAERVATLVSGLKGPVRVLDPACGDGNLLGAINDALPPDMRRRVMLVGIENDEASFASLRARQEAPERIIAKGREIEPAGTPLSTECRSL